MAYQQFTLPLMASGMFPQGVNNFGQPLQQQGSGFNMNDIMAGFDVLSGAVNAYTGLQQLNLAKDSFNFNKGVTTTNLANQAKTINTQLEDRQRARLASNPNAYQSLSEYMKKNSVSGEIGA